MSDLWFSLDAVLPIVLLVVIGYVLKRLGLIDGGVATVLNKLVYRLFLPVMLFLNVYEIESIGDVNLTYVAFSCVLTVGFFIMSIPVSMMLTKENAQRGAIVQGTCRSNTALIGVPLATSLYGTQGAILATVMSAFIIPLYNILSVLGLSMFSTDSSKKFSIKKVMADIVKNPLIQSIVLGLLVIWVRTIFQKCSIGFRLTDISFGFEVLEYLSGVATPVALIALGAQFEFSSISDYKKPIIWIIFSRGVLLPAVSILLALALGGFTGAHYATFISVFATPVAVATVPMAQEMDADSALAGQLVIFSTITSGFSIFLIVYILRAIGIF